MGKVLTVCIDGHAERGDVSRIFVLVHDVAPKHVASLNDNRLVRRHGVLSRLKEVGGARQSASEKWACAEMKTS